MTKRRRVRRQDRSKQVTTSRITETIGKFDGKIDEECKVVTEVALLGRESRNGRTYSDQALREAAAHLEGSKVFLNHREPGPGGRMKPHDVRDYMGRVHGCYVDEGGMVRARQLVLHSAEHRPLMETARTDPSAFGFSIDGVAHVRRGKVLSVKEINSVDLVAQPATVSGLFESEEGDDMENITIAELREDHADLVEEIEKPLKAAIDAAKTAATAQDAKITTMQESLDKLKADGETAAMDALLEEFEIGTEGVDKDMREQLAELGAEKARKILELRGKPAAKPAAKPRSAASRSDDRKAGATENLKEEIKQSWTGRRRTVFV